MEGSPNLDPMESLPLLHLHKSRTSFNLLRRQLLEAAYESVKQTTLVPRMYPQNTKLNIRTSVRPFQTPPTKHILPVTADLKLWKNANVYERKKRSSTSVTN